MQFKALTGKVYSCPGGVQLAGTKPWSNYEAANRTRRAEIISAQWDFLWEPNRTARTAHDALGQCADRAVAGECRFWQSDEHDRSVAEQRADSGRRAGRRQWHDHLQRS